MSGASRRLKVNVWGGGGGEGGGRGGRGKWKTRDESVGGKWKTRDESVRGKWKTRECGASGVDIRLLLDPLTAQHASLAPVSGRIRMPLAPSCGAHITHLESGEATDASLEKTATHFYSATM